MKFEDFYKVLVRNPGAKIISLIFAVFLWLHVTAQQGENQSFRVPLMLTGIPDSLTIIHDVPQSIEVTVRGPRSSLLKLRLFGRSKATIDLSMARKGIVNIPLSAGVLNLPEDFDPRNVSIDNPKTLVLNFERVITKLVPVRIAYKGKIPEDIIIMNTPVVIPARVNIRGASSIVSSINFLTTEEVDIRNRRGKITEETGLIIDGRSISVIPEKILIEMEVRKKATRILANIPPTLLQDDNEMFVDYFPKVVSLTIEGPEDIIREIVSDDISVILNITTREPGTYRLEPEVIVPQGVEKYYLDVEVFEITITEAAGSRSDGSGKDEGAEDEGQGPENR
ncbi:MAG: hypothetical protein KOO63_10155 [Bacteroidales bacterium]|nr:hypothetical protein [Candidatus Latescibacterota bacterium]